MKEILALSGPNNITKDNLKLGFTLIFGKLEEEFGGEILGIFDEKCTGNLFFCLSFL